VLVPRFLAAISHLLPSHELYRSQVADHRFYTVNDAARWNKLGLIKMTLRLAWIIWKETRGCDFDRRRPGLRRIKARSIDGGTNDLARQPRQYGADFNVSSAEGEVERFQKLEARRVLRPDGRFCFTVNDRSAGQGLSGWRQGLRTLSGACSTGQLAELARC
jgi:hypothetical protein